MRTAVANWQFEHPTRILFGEDRLTELPDLIATREVLLVTTPGSTRRGISGRLCKLLAAHEVTVLDTVAANPTLESIERRHISETLASFDGDKVAAARRLGIDLSTLYRKLKRYEEG